MLSIEKNTSAIKKDQSYYVFENFYDNKVAQIIGALYAHLYNNPSPNNITASQNLKATYITEAHTITNRTSMAAQLLLKDAPKQLNDNKALLAARSQNVNTQSEISYLTQANATHSNATALVTIKEALDLSHKTIRQARKSTQQIRKELNNIKNKTILALSNINNPSKLTIVKNDIRISLNNIIANINNASVENVNLLANDGKGIFPLISSFSYSKKKIKAEKIHLQESELALAVKKQEALDFTAGKLKLLFQTAQKAFNPTIIKQIEQAQSYTNFSKAIEITLTYIDKIDALLAEAEKQIDSHVDFLKKLKNTLSNKLSALIEANMDAEAARHAAQDVQEKLITQGIFLVNQSPQHLLSLYKTPRLPNRPINTLATKKIYR